MSCHYLEKNPELKQVFIETVNELKKPENVKKASEDFIKVVGSLESLHNKLSRRKKP